MTEKLAVLIGGGQGGARSLRAAIEKEGFPAQFVSPQWPRDHYVYADGNYVRRGYWKNGLENHFGDGGYVHIGDGYVLCGTGLSDIVPETQAFAGDMISWLSPEKHHAAKTALIAECQKHYPASKVHVIPSGMANGRGHNHLDMSVMLLPTNRLLIVDTHYGILASRGNEVDAVANQEELKCIRYDGSQDGVWYPLNVLAFPSEKGDIVFIDSQSKSLARLLEKEGVKCIPVEIPQHTYPAGKIHCMTNVLPVKDLVRKNDLLAPF